MKLLRAGNTAKSDHNHEEGEGSHPHPHPHDQQTERRPLSNFWKMSDNQEINRSSPANGP
jgi:hypothetical protein